MWYAVYSLTADARSVQVPNKRDVSGVTIGASQLSSISLSLGITRASREYVPCCGFRLYTLLLNLGEMKHCTVLNTPSTVEKAIQSGRAPLLKGAEGKMLAIKSPAETGMATCRSDGDSLW